eukprot:760215-Hanusia_phi.AAC.1
MRGRERERVEGWKQRGRERVEDRRGERTERKEEDKGVTLAYRCNVSLLVQESSRLTKEISERRWKRRETVRRGEERERKRSRRTRLK